MPRKDRTFNDKDIVRLIKKYLDSGERAAVKAAVVAMEEDAFDKVVEAAGLLGEILLTVIDILALVDKLPRILRGVPVIGTVITALLVIKDTLEFVGEVFDVFT